MGSVKYFIGALGLILLTVGHAFGCTCVNEPMPEAYEKAGAVFAGKVVGIMPTAPEGGSTLPGQQVTMEVTRSWKRVTDYEVSLRSGNPCGGCCGYYFQRGETYLVFASAARDGTLYTSKCMQTVRYSEAGERLGILGAGTAVEKPGAVARHLRGISYAFITSVTFLCGVSFFF